MEVAVDLRYREGLRRTLGLATSPVKRSLLRGLRAALRAVGAASRREPSGIRWSIGVAALVLVVAGACLYFNARRYLPFMADDAFISLRYSERFLQGKGLTWNDGERVEGYSNLTWVLATALLGLALDDLLLSARVLGVLSAWACLAALVYRWRRLALPEAIASGGAALMVAAAGPLAVWAIGGLEQPLFAALLAWSYVSVFRAAERSREEASPTSVAHGTGARSADFRWRAWALPGVLLGLLSLTRPDGFLFVVPLVFCAVVVPGGPAARFRAATVLACVPAVFVALQLAFRLLYYGEWVPNTALAKLSWTPERQEQGTAYVRAGLTAAWPLVALASTSLFCLRASGPRFRVATLVAALSCWLAYVTSIGGDIFPAWRHLVAAFVLLALLATEGLRTLLRRAAWGWPMVVVVLGVLVAKMDALQRNDIGMRKARHERWEWDAPPIAELLRRNFGDKEPLLAVDSAGCLPFFSKLPALDMLGLNDAYLTHHPPPDLGKGELGHELGDGRYFLERKPDIVLFGAPSDHGHPKFRGGREMVRDRDFARNYQLVTFLAGEPESAYRVWLRTSSEKLGLQRSSSQILVPGYFFAGGEGATAREVDGALVTSLEPGAVADFGLRLPERGLWRIEAATSAGEVMLSTRVKRRRLRGAGPLEVRVARPTHLKIRVQSAGHAAARLRHVSLTKVEQKGAEARVVSSPAEPGLGKGSAQ